MLEGFLVTCSIDYVSKNAETMLMNALLFAGTFLAPAVLTVAANLLLIKRLKNREILFFSLRLPVNQSSRMSDTASENSNILEKRKSGKIEAKTIPNTISRYLKLPHRRSWIREDLLKKNFMKSQMRVVRKTVIVIAIFFLGLGPYAVLTLYIQFSSHFNATICVYWITVAAFLAKTAVVLSPLIYGINNILFGGLKKITREMFHSS